VPSATEPVATSVPLAMKIHQKKLGGVEEGRLTSVAYNGGLLVYALWLLYLGVYPIKK
jgi:hypothetical protein